MSFLKTSEVDALNRQPVQGEGKRAGVECSEVYTVIPSAVLLAPPMLVLEHETETRPYSKPLVLVIFNITKLLQYMLVLDVMVPLELRKMQTLTG